MRENILIAAKSMTAIFCFHLCNMNIIFTAETNRLVNYIAGICVLNTECFIDFLGIETTSRCKTTSSELMFMAPWGQARQDHSYHRSKSYTNYENTSFSCSDSCLFRLLFGKVQIQFVEETTWLRNQCQWKNQNEQHNQQLPCTNPNDIIKQGSAH